MSMHEKIIAFAMSLDMTELQDNRLILLTDTGLLSALPVYSDDDDVQAKTLFQCLNGFQKTANENFKPITKRHMVFDDHSILLKDIKLISPQSVQTIGAMVLKTSSVIAVSIGNFEYSH